MNRFAISFIAVILVGSFTSCTGVKNPLLGNGAGYDMVPRATDAVVVATQTGGTSSASNNTSGQGIRLIDFAPSDQNSSTTGQVVPWSSSQSKWLCQGGQSVGETLQWVEMADATLCQVSSISPIYMDGNVHYLNITPVSSPGGTTSCNSSGECAATGASSYNGGPQLLKIQATLGSDGHAATLEASFCTGGASPAPIYQTYYLHYLRNDPTQNGQATLLEKGQGLMNQVTGMVNDQAQWITQKTMSTILPGLQSATLVQTPNQIQVVQNNGNGSAISQVAAAMGFVGTSLANYVLMDGVTRTSQISSTNTNPMQGMLIGGGLRPRLLRLQTPRPIRLLLHTIMK